MQLNLKGKVVLVTGGTKGIGRAIVEGFLAEGAFVHFCSRTNADVEDAAKELATLALQSSGTISGATVDITQATQVKDWVMQVSASEGQIDAVVSNVSSLSVSNTPEDWNTAYNTDMLGTVSLIDACLPYLEKTKGSIITISSVSGRDVDFTAPSPYGAFKAALIHYTAQLAHTLASKGIRANTVSPGNIYIEDGVWGDIEEGDPELFKNQLAKNPMGRMGKASEVADVVVFLTSERASFVSGTNVVVDGSLCTGVQF
ncbi:hypothetical protein ONS95_010662 [Cadophora gregata]|uniref:uncharacterized protein n=1 Tax=Cadophora gregata TaxID=51156 RepID=UPI0026DD8218|nr:uncharacterized protein ONS95_010662 [Cadophora gregata]KAK0122426.1 hypothetical protein ONS95_010662 [Cadophora gregata]KAK0127903.1 hypothetical protein ONS96_007403 [Cadophora gregata f. sp. sojae]